jgi:heme/copper-type cytochrome/quinol oxidase subunit 2
MAYTTPEQIITAMAERKLSLIVCILVLVGFIVVGVAFMLPACSHNKHIKNLEGGRRSPQTAEDAAAKHYHDIGDE